MVDAPRMNDKVDSNPAVAFEFPHQNWEAARESSYGASATRSSDTGSIPRAIEKGARNLASDIAGKSDAEVAKEFGDFGQKFKGQNALALSLSLNSAFHEKGEGWYTSANSNGNLKLFKEDPNENKIVAETKFFKAGEDKDAEFNPNRVELKKIAADFAHKHPEALAPESLKVQVDKLLGEMKAVGAGPSDARNALNDALEANKVKLKFNINYRGAVAVEHQNRPVAEVNI